MAAKLSSGWFTPREINDLLELSVNAIVAPLQDRLLLPSLE